MATSNDVFTMLPEFNEAQLDEQKILRVELPSLSLGFGHLFGGQAFSQAVRAAQLWLEKLSSPMTVHLAHGVFLKAGTADDPVTYEVTPLGLGRTFQRFQVRAFQNSSLVFQALVSAQGQERSLIQHQQTMPQVPGPDDGLMTDRELKAKATGRPAPTNQRPIDVRVATPDSLLLQKTAEDHYGFWFRYNKPVIPFATPLTLGQKQAFLAYASDYGFLGGLFVPHSAEIRLTPFFITSLDHGLWYYKPYDPMEWAYFEIESPVADHGRGVVTGRIYQESALVAVAIQEGLLRRRD